MHEFEETGSTGDRVSHLQHRSVRPVKNVAAVSESVAEHSETSICCLSHSLDLSYDSLWRLLHKDLHLRAK